MGKWDDVEQWQLRQLNLHSERQVQLLRYGYLLMPSNDGLLWARRLRPEDVPGEPIEGRPEVKSFSYELLLAEVKARNGRGVPRA